jgi:hypothetical protein
LNKLQPSPSRAPRLRTRRVSRRCQRASCFAPQKAEAALASGAAPLSSPHKQRGRNCRSRLKPEVGARGPDSFCQFERWRRRHGADDRVGSRAGASPAIALATTRWLAPRCPRPLLRSGRRRASAATDCSSTPEAVTLGSRALRREPRNRRARRCALCLLLGLILASAIAGSAVLIGGVRSGTTSGRSLRPTEGVQTPFQAVGHTDA